ncbi:cytochrome P450 [Dactylosporangium sp. NPDC005572]|uniref:cytochrome P450 n=1 Tax=Dactylosporangium sp. NPDC005572 TaxID=3156889 RepID=UPI0033BD50FF
MPKPLFDTDLRIDAPGPRGVPIVNNLRLIRESPRYLLNRIGPFDAQPVVPVTAGNGSVVVVRGRAGVRQVFTDNASFHRADGLLDLPPGRPWSGMFDAVITANGGEHTRRRKLLMPAVHRTALDHYTAVFADTFERSRFAGANDEPFELVRECLRVTKANMMRCLLGLDDGDGLSAFADRIVRLAAEAADPRVLLFKRDLPWTPYGRWLRRVAGAYDQLALLIAERRGGAPRPDALSILCHAVDEDGDRLSTEEIAGELHGFFAAGFETTAMTLSLALVTLMGSVDPATDGPGADPADPAQLDALVKESQRLLPAVPITLPRRVTRPVEIDTSPPIPQGALLFLSPLLEHRNPAVFAEPEVFRPARWIGGSGPKQYEFIPFGLGPRRCLGAEFADLQVRTTLSLMAERGLPGLVTTRVDYGTVNGVTAGPTRPIVVRPRAGGWSRLTGTVTDVWKPVR